MDAPLPPAPVIRSKKEGFWERQSSPNSTTAQDIFDVLFGAIIPVLLLIYDPVVFRNTGSCYATEPLLEQYATFAYLAIGLGVVALLIWLFVGMGPYKAVAAGILFTGTLFAAVVGIAILPTSIPGLLILLGALGFVPFLTAFVYYRNGRRAYRAAYSSTPDWKKITAGMIAGFILAIGLPAAAQLQVTSTIASAMPQIVANPVTPDPASIEALTHLNALCLHLCTSNIQVAFVRAAYAREESRQALGEIYTQITYGTLPASCYTNDYTND